MVTVNRPAGVPESDGRRDILNTATVCGRPRASRKPPALATPGTRETVVPESDSAVGDCLYYVQASVWRLHCPVRSYLSRDLLCRLLSQSMKYFTLCSCLLYMSYLVTRVVTFLYCQKWNELYRGSLDNTITAVEIVRKVTANLRLGSHFNNKTGREKGELKRSLLWWSMLLSSTSNNEKVVGCLC